MCLVLPARVTSVNGQMAEVEMVGGMRATANTIHCPSVAVDQYVLVDRGLVLQIIDEAEAQAILGIYDEIGEMLTAAEEAAYGAPELAQVPEAMYG